MKEARLRLPAILIGLVFVVICCAFTPFNNVRLQNSPLAGGHFPLGATFIAAWLFVFSAAAAALTRRPPALTGLEVLAAWALMLVSSGLGATGLTRAMFIAISGPEYFAKGYTWPEEIGGLIPGCLRPDATAVELMYNGLEGGRDMGWIEVLGNAPWGSWLAPLLAWAAFILLAYLAMVSLVNLFGRQWIVNERVNFPLLRLPLTFTEAFDQGGLANILRSNYLLAGAAIPVLLHLLNGWHAYNPAAPQLPTLILAGPYFPKYGLFSGFHKLNMYIYPAVIGFAFLTTRQISFSFWIFYLFGGLLFGLLYVFGLRFPEAALGVTFAPDLAQPEQAQSIGAWLIFFLFLLWLARFHLRDAVRQAFFCAPADRGLHGEWVPRCWSLWGALAGLAGLAAWSLWAGLPVVFFIFMLVASRIVCQGGLPFFTLPAAPLDALNGLLGSGFLGRTGLAATAVMQKVLFLDVQESLMPSMFHAAKASEKARNRLWILAAIGAALLLGVAVSFIAMLALGYRYGFRELQLEWATETTLATYSNIQHLLDAPSGANPWVLSFASAGAVAMVCLVVCYYRFPWWPIHPLGYLAAYSAAMKVLWFSILLGWLANHLCLRYGGTVFFRRLRLLFMGLILGDLLMGGMFWLLGLWTGRAYPVFPAL